jgi:hypothetical protein
VESTALSALDSRLYNATSVLRPAYGSDISTVVPHHLRALRAAGIVSRRHCKMLIYALPAAVWAGAEVPV